MSSTRHFHLLQANHQALTQTAFPPYARGLEAGICNSTQNSSPETGLHKPQSSMRFVQMQDMIDMENLTKWLSL